MLKKQSLAQLAENEAGKVPRDKVRQSEGDRLFGVNYWDEDIDHKKAVYEG